MPEKKLLFLLFTVLWPQAVNAASPATHEYMLDNGLKILVQEDHRAPVAVTQVWYKVGASYEHDGLTGISHMLEHMMFKGTEKLSPGEFSRIISENGGSENAFTGADYTAYFETLDQSRLPISFELEADRMRDLRLLEKEFIKERNVVMEERRLRTEDNPQSLTYEKAMSVAYQTSPYRQPVIGWMADIAGYRLEDLSKWYEKWYAPNNATLVVVGDVDPENVLALAKKTFGKQPRGAEIAATSRPEVAQNGEKRVVVREIAKVPYIILGYKVPSLKTSIDHPEDIPEQEIYALEVLSGLLDGGDSARLTKHLIRGKQIAASASAGYNMLARLNTLFMLSGAPTPGHDIKKLEDALRAEIELIKDKPIAPTELERIKTQVITSDVYEKDSMFYQAMQLGQLETVGLDWKEKDRYVEKVKGVTAEQVQAVAKKYLTPARLTVAVLEPLPSDNARGE